jgi:hypothetical protein
MKYRVGLCVTAYTDYEVEAESEEAAVKAAEALYEDGGVADLDFDSYERWPLEDIVEEAE